MYLKELEIGKEIIIETNLKDKHIEFNTQIVGIEKNILILRPIIKDEKVVSFSSENIKSNIIYKNIDDKEYIFKNVKIISKKNNNNKLFYFVSGENLGEIRNRRKTPRYEIYKHCILTPGIHKKTEDVRIKDISINGVGIISEKKIDIKVGDMIKIALKPNEKDRKHIEINAKVVRLEINQSTKEQLIGCEILNENSNWNKYVMEIQRKRIRVQGNKK